jgi:hypothetical protein
MLVACKHQIPVSKAARGTEGEKKRIMGGRSPKKWENPLGIGGEQEDSRVAV